jgi:hypothetical protein
VEISCEADGTDEGGWTDWRFPVSSMMCCKEVGRIVALLLGRWCGRAGLWRCWRVTPWPFPGLFLLEPLHLLNEQSWKSCFSTKDTSARLQVLIAENVSQRLSWTRIKEVVLEKCRNCLIYPLLIHGLGIWEGYFPTK